MRHRLVLSARPTTPSIASVADALALRKIRFFTSCYSWCDHKVLAAKRRNRRQHTKERASPQRGERCTPLFHNLKALSSKSRLPSTGPVLSYTAYRTARTPEDVR